MKFNCAHRGCGPRARWRERARSSRFWECKCVRRWGTRHEAGVSAGFKGVMGTNKVKKVTCDCVITRRRRGGSAGCVRVCPKSSVCVCVASRGGTRVVGRLRACMCVRVRAASSKAGVGRVKQGRARTARARDARNPRTQQSHAAAHTNPRAGRGGCRLNRAVAAPASAPAPARRGLARVFQVEGMPKNGEL